MFENSDGLILSFSALNKTTYRQIISPSMSNDLSTIPQIANIFIEKQNFHAANTHGI